MLYQKTLRDTVSCEGVGVHSGATTTLTLAPAKAGTGITFVRSDVIDRDNVIPGTWDRVTQTRLCTVLTNDAGVNISTVEHVLSALAAQGVDNVVITVDGEEMPIMDGSADVFMKMIDQVGTRKQNAPKRFIRLLRPVTYTEGDMSVTLTPSYQPEWLMDIDFTAKSKKIGTQSFSFSGGVYDYRRKISRARTFGFLNEVEALKEMGLARGGSLENAIVVDGDNILNPEGLRYDNEFVRHKILDAIGDLYLAGAPILADYHGVKAGHAMNNKVLREVFADPMQYEWVTSADVLGIIQARSSVRVTYAAPSPEVFASLA